MVSFSNKAAAQIADNAKKVVDGFTAVYSLFLLGKETGVSYYSDIEAVELLLYKKGT